MSISILTCCDKESAPGVWEEVEVVDGEEVGEREELNAPLEDFCRRSNSSCSFWGSRGGEGVGWKVALQTATVLKE